LGPCRPGRRLITESGAKDGDHETPAIAGTGGHGRCAPRLGAGPGRGGAARFSDADDQDRGAVHAPQRRRQLGALLWRAARRANGASGGGVAVEWGEGVVVENRPGANGIIALQAVKHAPADGYTLLLASNSPMAVNPLAIKDLGYDPVKDYKPLSGLARSMNAIVVANDSPLATLEALLAAAKAGPLTVGTYSAGYHLAAAW